MIFHLDERHCLKATVLEGGKKSINWVSVAILRPQVGPTGKLENFNYLNFYHVGLNAVLGLPHPGPTS